MMASVTSALLAINLTAAAAYFGTGQSRLGALALRVQLSADNQMNSGFIHFGAENGIRQFDFTNLGALHVEYCYLRHCFVLLP